MDNEYWWHNLLLVRPRHTRFHYPFKSDYGDAPAYVGRLVKPWVGERVLELGCGTGWLREEWNLASYVGIERNHFERPFEAEAKEEARQNGVIHMAALEYLSDCSCQFDTLVCYETFHLCKGAVRQAVTDGRLRPEGSVVIVDALKWCSVESGLADLPLQQVYAHEIPIHWFDLEAVACACLDAVEALEAAQVRRKEILEIARGAILPQLYNGLQVGMTVDRLRQRLPELELAPADLHYSVLVFQVTTGTMVSADSSQRTPQSQPMGQS